MQKQILCISNKAAYHPKMNIKAVRLLSILNTLVKSKSYYCTPTNKYLHLKASLSIRSVEYNLNLLEKLGFIKKKSGNPRKIYITNGRI